MRILVVLWTVCLVRICNAGWRDCFGLCGNKKQEPEEAYTQAEQSEDTSSEATSPTGSEPPNGTSPEVQDSTGQPDNPSSENAISETENVPSPQGVINVSNTDPSIYQSFDYSFAGNAIKLIVPKNGQSITKLISGTENVYTVPNGEKLEYADVYLNKDGKPELMHIVLRSSNGSTRDRYMELKDGKWEPCRNPTDKMKSLVTSTKWVSDFTLDLSSTNDTDKCTIFEVDLLGVTTKHFFPKPGHLATKVKNGSKNLWTGQSHSFAKGASVNRCLSCIIYKKNGTELLEMTVVENGSRRKKYFEKNDEEWKEIKKKEDFNEKLATMMRLAYLSKLTPIKLDVSSVDGSTFTVQDSSDGGVAVKTFTPKNGYRLTEVTDGSASIWKGEEDNEHSRSAWFYYDTTEKPTLATVRFIKSDGKNDFVHYVKGDDVVWKTVDQKEYDAKLTNIRRDVILSKQSVSLDIGSVDANTFTIQDSKDGGVPLRHITPKDGRITEVSDGSASIWKASDEGEHCTTVLLHYDKEKPVLAAIVTYKLEDGQDNTLYRYKDDDEWKEIKKKEDFNEKLKGMMTPPSSQPTEASNDS